MPDRPRTSVPTSAVPLVEIEVGGTLPFDVQTHLRLNDKYVPVAKAGEPWTETKVRKMRELKLDALVPVDELPAYYDYASEVMRRAVENTADPEKLDRLREMAGELFRALLTELYRQSRANPEAEFTHARKILDLMIAGESSPWLERLLATREGQSPFSHASMTGYDAACLALMNGDPSWRTAAIAGFFLGEGVEATEAADRLAALEPETPAEILEAIRRSPDRDWSQAPTASRCVALASRFDLLTRVQDKQIPLSPDQALRQIQRENNFEPALVDRLVALYPDPADKR